MNSLRKDGIIKGSPIEEKPELFPDLGEVYEAFITLSGGRHYNESGLMPITFSDVICYLNDRNILNLDERREFQHLLRTLDSKYLELVHAKMARERDRLMKKSQSGTVKRGR